MGLYKNVQRRRQVQKSWNLYQRIHALPYEQIKAVRQEVLKLSGVHRKTYIEVLKGDSNNKKVLEAIAKVLHCRIEDLSNKDYKFSNPKLEPVKINHYKQNKKQGSEGIEGSLLINLILSLIFNMLEKV